MKRIEGSAVVKRPIEEVWAFMTDPFRLARRGGGTLAVRVTPSGPMGLGSTVRVRFVILGLERTFSYLVTEWDPPHTMTGSVKDEGVARGGFIRIALEATPAGTEVMGVAEIEPRGIAKLLAPIAWPIAKRQAQARMKNMKRLLEAGPARGERIE